MEHGLERDDLLRGSRGLDDIGGPGIGGDVQIVPCSNRGAVDIDIGIASGTGKVIVDIGRKERFYVLCNLVRIIEGLDQPGQDDFGKFYRVDCGCSLGCSPDGHIPCRESRVVYSDLRLAVIEIDTLSECHDRKCGRSQQGLCLNVDLVCQQCGISQVDRCRDSVVRGRSTAVPRLCG